MQAIVTKYLGATMTRPSRIKASCSSGSITVTYPDGNSLYAPHRVAAEQLRDKMGWNGKLIGGGMPGGGFCFVFDPKTI